MSGSHHQSDWRLLEYFAGRFDGRTAVCCCLSAAAPWLVLLFRMAVDPQTPLGPVFAVWAVHSPSLVCVPICTDLWAHVLRRYLTAEAGPLLRISGDGRRLFRGLVGVVGVRTAVAWLCSIPSVLMIAGIVPDDDRIIAVVLAGIAILLTVLAVIVSVQTLSLLGRHLPSHLATGTFVVALFLLAQTSIIGLGEVSALLISLSLASAVPAVVIAAIAFFFACRYAESRFGGSTEGSVAVPTQQTEDDAGANGFRLSGEAPQTRKPRPLWSDRPGVVLAFRRTFFGGGLMAGMPFSFLAVFGVFAFLTSRSLRAATEIILEMTNFAASAMAVVAIIGVVVGPLQAVSREKESQTFGLLVLAMGQREAALSLAKCTLLGIAALALPAALWLLARTAYAGGISPVAFVLISTTVVFATLASIYGLWAAIRAEDPSQALAILLIAVLIFPMLFAAPRLLRNQLKTELVPDST